MNSVHLFKMALGIELPWEMASVKFETKDGSQELHINIDFKKG